MIAPRTHWTQPTLPCYVWLAIEGHTEKSRRSLRKMEERMAEITTDIAPRGVTRIAGTKVIVRRVRKYQRRKRQSLRVLRRPRNK
jgi:hypothetical protein